MPVFFDGLWIMMYPAQDHFAWRLCVWDFVLLLLMTPRDGENKAFESSRGRGGQIIAVGPSL